MKEMTCVVYLLSFTNSPVLTLTMNSRLWELVDNAMDAKLDKIFM